MSFENQSAEDRAPQVRALIQRYLLELKKKGSFCFVKKTKKQKQNGMSHLNVYNEYFIFTEATFWDFFVLNFFLKLITCKVNKILGSIMHTHKKNVTIKTCVNACSCAVSRSV